MNEKYFEEIKRKFNRYIETDDCGAFWLSDDVIDFLKQIARDQREAIMKAVERVPRWINSETITKGDDFVCRYEAIQSAVSTAEIEKN